MIGVLGLRSAYRQTALAIGRLAITPICRSWASGSVSVIALLVGDADRGLERVKGAALDRVAGRLEPSPL